MRVDAAQPAGERIPPTHETPGPVSGLGRAVEGGASAASSSIVTLLLPSPPSANALFENKPGRGRVRSAMYDMWLSHAGWKLRAQNAGRVAGEVIILIGVERTSAMADIDNRIKPTLDLLVKQNVIDDDRFVVGVAAAWSPSRAGLMRLAIIPAADLAVRFQLAPGGAAGGWFLEAPQSEEGAI